MQSEELGEEDKRGSYVVAAQGLFPRPLPHGKQGSKSPVLERFRLLGRAMAKALQDNRMLDIPLSYVFYKCDCYPTPLNLQNNVLAMSLKVVAPLGLMGCRWYIHPPIAAEFMGCMAADVCAGCVVPAPRLALGRPVDLYDISRIDSGLGASLEKLSAAHAAHAATGRRVPMLLDGVKIEDLCLTFVLPGYPEYELQPGGADMVVDASNVKAYIDAVAEASLFSGIKGQMQAFCDGFNEVRHRVWSPPPVICLKPATGCCAVEPGAWSVAKKGFGMMGSEPVCRCSRCGALSAFMRMSWKRCCVGRGSSGAWTCWQTPSRSTTATPATAPPSATFCRC